MRRYFVLWYDQKHPDINRKFTFTMNRVADDYKRHKMSGHLEWAQKHLSTKYNIPYANVRIYDDGYTL